jgi:prepilin-type processing-associated H-X9-DG protein
MAPLRRLSSFIAAALLVSAQALPQSAPAAVASSQGDRAATVLPSEIKPEWKALRLTVSQSGGGGGIMDMLMGMMGGLLGAGAGAAKPGSGMEIMTLGAISWVTGETTKMFDQDFVVTYKIDLDMAVMENPATPPDFTKLPLRLTLVNAKSISTITPLPDMTREKFLEFLAKANESMKTGPGSTPPESSAAAPETALSSQVQGLSNIKQLALAAHMYASDYDDVFPYAQSTATVKAVTMPYLKSIEAWTTHNPSESRFLFNMAVAGALLGEIDSPNEVVLFYESAPWPDGRRHVAFCDGHARTVSEDEWTRLKETLKLKLRKIGRPLPPDHFLAELERMGIKP